MATNRKFTGKFGIAIMIAVILLIAGTVLVFNNYLISNPQNSTIENQYSVENKTSEYNEPSPLAKEAEELAKKENITGTSSWSSTLDSLTQTSEPKFVVGEKYTYFVRWPQPTDMNKPGMHSPNVIFNDYRYFNISFTLEKKEKINRTDCYKISTEGSGEVINGFVKDERGTRPIISVPIDSSVSYIGVKTGNFVNPETGDIIKGIEEKHEVSGLSTLNVYTPWMLKLSEGIKWTNIYEQKSTGSIVCNEGMCKAIKENEEITEEETCEVKEIENINKRKCFKVECRSKLCKNNLCEITYKRIYWVDVEKRITVKYQLWYQNLQTVEVELVNYEK